MHACCRAMPCIAHLVAWRAEESQAPPPDGSPCTEPGDLSTQTPQAAQQQDRFAIFVEAPRCSETYVSLNRRTQPYNRLVSHPTNCLTNCLTDSLV